MRQLAPSQMATMLLSDLENAAIDVERRRYYLSRSLYKYLHYQALEAIAFIPFSPWLAEAPELIYIGPESEKRQAWITQLLAESKEDSLVNLMKANQEGPLAQAKLTPLEEAILLTWPQPDSRLDPILEQSFIDGLSAISYVEKKEAEYFYDIGSPFDDQVKRAIQAKDQDGLMELLSLTRQMTDSDITFWGETTSREIQVNMHLGSRQEDFGFLLPLGKGIGGLAAKNKIVLQVEDYRNCAYRYKDVSQAVDAEKIRTVLALPLKDRDQQTSGVLYVGNRTINPLPLEKKFLLLRLSSQLEPIVKRKDIKSFFVNDHRQLFFKRKKAELRQLGRRAKQADEVADWLADLLDGDVEILYKGEEGIGNEASLAGLGKSKPNYTYPIEEEGSEIGRILIWTDIQLPLERHWPDLMDDVIHCLFFIKERKEQLFHLIDLERSQWLHNMLQQAQASKHHYAQAIQLQIPVDQGEIWAFLINKESDRLSIEDKMAIEKIALSRLRRPVYFNGNTGYILFDHPIECSPESFRNQLLSLLPVETYLIHGASYSSFRQMQDLLKQLHALLEGKSFEQVEDYVITFEQFGLDKLFSNPNINGELYAFAQHILQPVIEYDQVHDTELTKTLALSLVYKSASKVAASLYIHPNTVHYRVNRAKRLLRIQLDQVSQDLALTFAAYAWLFKHQLLLDEDEKEKKGD